MITATQLVAHAAGDYLLQSDWMAHEKTKRWTPALIHGAAYGLPFLLFRPSLAAIACIVLTHAVIDRLRLARYVVFAKNFLAPPPWPRWSECSGTGYHRDRPPWMSVWLLIVADNVMHVCVNALALRYL